MKDKLLEMFFERKRWETAIEKGIVKDIDKGVLAKLCECDKIVNGRTVYSARTRMLEMIRSGRYRIVPPHTAYIPKDNGEFRTVYVNEAADRILLGIANDLLFETCADMIHKSCTSYQKGIGCGMVVQDVSRHIVNASKDMNGVVGWKADFTKYFDRLPIEYIDKAFDEVERRHGHSSLIDVLRRYYHSNVYYDTKERRYVEKYQSLKQGCAVASFLANVIMYDLDERLSNLDGLYKRYCDDTIFIGKDYNTAMQIMADTMESMSTPELCMRLNENKVEYIHHNKWFKFLGFSIKGDMISLSETRIKNFADTIRELTIQSNSKPKTIIKDVMRYLYAGNGEHSWATQVLPVINVKSDITELNGFVMDAIRASQTHKTKIGGLGYVKTERIGRGCISRGVGRNVRSNRQKTSAYIDGYQPLSLMKNAMRYNKSLYKSILNTSL